MRSSEACSLEWRDVDLHRRIIVFNKPLKNGKPRIFKISSKLKNMLSTLPKKNNYLFGTNKKVTRQTAFYKARKRLAAKLDNPRLLRKDSTLSDIGKQHWNTIKRTTFYMLKSFWDTKDWIQRFSIFNWKTQYFKATWMNLMLKLSVNLNKLNRCLKSDLNTSVKKTA